MSKIEAARREARLKALREQCDSGDGVFEGRSAERPSGAAVRAARGLVAERGLNPNSARFVDELLSLLDSGEVSGDVAVAVLARAERQHYWRTAFRAY